MPYPSDSPTAKHDLVVPRLPPSTSLMDLMGLPNTPAYLKKLSEPIPSNMKLLSAVYSYDDGPEPPLSRSLYVVGVIPSSHAVVRKLVKSQDDALHRCKIAVKRADGRYAGQLDEKHLKASSSFAHFMQQLRQDGVAAVLGVDKLGRTGILQPLATAHSNGEFDQDDFHVTCFFGTFEGIKEALTRVPVQEQEESESASAVVPKSPPPPPGGFDDDGLPVPKSPPPPAGGFNDEGPVWNPNNGGGDDDDGPTFRPPVDDGPTFQPTDDSMANNNNKDDGPSWNPGGSDDGGGLWQPDGGNDAGGGWDSAPAPGAAGGLWDPGSSSSGGDQNGSAGLWEPSSNDDGGFGGATASEWDQVDTTTGSRKRTLPDDASDNDDEDDDNDGDKFHADSGAAAADKFYSNLTRNQGTRADSRLYHMRAFNGWVKATQIQELNPQTKGTAGKVGMGPIRILDLACGKGGDLTKWVIQPRGIANYVGSDVARGSLVDAAIRARKMSHRLKSCTFSCADLGHDVPGRLRSAKHKQMQKLLTWSLQNERPGETSPPEFKMLRGGGIKPEDRFDVVSIQFAIHYMMQTRNRARRFFRTVSQLLDVGGNLIATTIDARVVIAHLLNLGLNLHFDEEEPTIEGLGGEPVVAVGGGACRITFEPQTVKQIFEDHKDEKLPERLFGLEYTFTLVEGSDHAAGVGDAVNLPEWLIPIPSLEALAEEVGLELEYAQNFHEFYQKRADPAVNSAAHSSLYNMKVLNRNGSISEEEWEISRLYMAIKFRKVREPVLTPLDDDDAEEDENVEEDEIDPAVKAKLMPMAMIKAKKANAATWETLSPEERMTLTEIELKKLAKK